MLLNRVNLIDGDKNSQCSGSLQELKDLRTKLHKATRDLLLYPGKPLLKSGMLSSIRLTCPLIASLLTTIRGLSAYPNRGGCRWGADLELEVSIRLRQLLKPTFSQPLCADAFNI